VPETNIITSVYVDSEGNQWYGTPNGVLEHTSREAKANWTIYNMEYDGLPSDDILSIAGDDDGYIWIDTRDSGVASFDGSTWTSYSLQDKLASNKVYCIAVDTDGSVWFGTDNGISHLQGRTWTTYQAEYNLPLQLSYPDIPETNRIAMILEH
jgi:ligand-binding sensor domain-containing protein